MAVTCMGVRADSAADDWYKNEYAPLWKENVKEKLDESLAYYEEAIQVHPGDGPTTTVNLEEWMFESLDEWTEAGWSGSDVAAFHSDQLNASTVTFKVKWLDRYVDGSEEFSCGWYLAARKNDKWLFTQYATIDCEAHGL